MSEAVDRAKARLAAVEDEFTKLPMLASSVIGLLKLGQDEFDRTDTAKWRMCFRILLAKFVLDALLRRSHFGDVELAAEALGESVLEDVSGAVDRLVGELLEFAETADRKTEDLI